MGIKQSRLSAEDEVMEKLSQLTQEQRGVVLKRLLSGDQKGIPAMTMSLWSFMTHRVIRGLNAQQHHPQSDVLSYSGICPCCRKPLSIDIDCHSLSIEGGEGLEGLLSPPTPSRYAYVTVLYGTKPSYFLQALVCGWGLRSMGSAHDIVLVHTRDVPATYLECLGQVFTKLHPVDYINCCTRLLAGEQSSRFDLVFTKLRCLELDQLGYTKIVLVDTDTLCVKNMDDLFDLEAPAAMKRGAWQPQHGTEFRAEWMYSRGWWGNSTGINAGIMLLTPDTSELEGMIDEISDDTHPEHCYCNGPEQDYLSRYYPQWRHISCRYNFQLHHLYFHCMDSPFYTSIEWNTLGKDDIKMFHYSTETKPSDWVLEKILASIDGNVPESLASFALTMRARLPGYVGICAVDPAITLGMSPSSWSFPYGMYMSADWVRTRYWHEWMCRSPTLSTCTSTLEAVNNEPDTDGSSGSSGWQLHEMPEYISRAALERADNLTTAAFEEWYRTYLAAMEHLHACGIDLESILLRGLCGTLCAGCNELLLSEPPRAFPLCMTSVKGDEHYCSYCCESWETNHMWDEDYNINTVERVEERTAGEERDCQVGICEVDTVNDDNEDLVESNFESINSYRVNPRYVEEDETWVVIGRLVHAGKCPDERLHVGTATWKAEAFRMSFTLGLDHQACLEDLPARVIELVDSRDNTIIAVNPRGSVALPCQQATNREATQPVLDPGSTAKFTISVNLSPRPQLQRIEVEKIANRACHMPSRCVYGGSPQIDVNIRVCLTGPNYHVFIGDNALGVNSLYDLFVTPSRVRR